MLWSQMKMKKIFREGLKKVENSTLGPDPPLEVEKIK